MFFNFDDGDFLQLRFRFRRLFALGGGGYGKQNPNCNGNGQRYMVMYKNGSVHLRNRFSELRPATIIF